MKCRLYALKEQVLLRRRGKSRYNLGQVALSFFEALLRLSAASATSRKDNTSPVVELGYCILCSEDFVLGKRTRFRIAWAQGSAFRISGRRIFWHAQKECQSMSTKIR